MVVEYADEVNGYRAVILSKKNRGVGHGVAVIGVTVGASLTESLTWKPTMLREL